MGEQSLDTKVENNAKSADADHAGDALRNEALGAAGTATTKSDATTRPDTTTKPDANPSGSAKTDGAEQVRVLTFNIAVDGSMGLPGVIDLIRQSHADVVGLQESEGNSQKIADALGMHMVHSGDTALLTRYDIDEVTPAGNGMVVHTDTGKKLAFFDEHLYYKPYQPYQLLGIPYQDGKFVKTAAEAIDEANKARGENVQEVRRDIASLKDAGIPTILVGDFNEPSYLDWTDATAKAGRHPLKVEWPATKAFADDGFVDSYRKIYPDEMAHPGNTWTPTTSIDDPKDHHDRIDFILYRGNGIQPKSAEVIGENAKNADVVVSPFPSDHRAVTAVFELAEQAKK